MHASLELHAGCSLYELVTDLVVAHLLKVNDALHNGQGPRLVRNLKDLVTKKLFYTVTIFISVASIAHFNNVQF